MTFNDPYYWMEAGGPVFTNWLSAEATYTRQQIDAISGREALLAQIKSLDAGEMYVGTVLLAGREWIFSELRPTDSTAKIYRRAVADGTEHGTSSIRRNSTSGGGPHMSIIGMCRRTRGT